MEELEPLKLSGVQEIVYEPLKVVIDRLEWYRGQGFDESALLRKTDNRKCCLGFAALVDGAIPLSIRGINAPHQIVDSNILARLRNGADAGMEKNGSSTELCYKMMATNDSKMEESDREQELIGLGKKVNIEFSFIN